MIVPEYVYVLVSLPLVAVYFIYVCYIAKSFAFGFYVNFEVHYSKVKVDYGSVLLRQFTVDIFTFALTAQ